MKTVADPVVRRSLIERLGALTTDSRRRWGPLTPHEMLCHLGDATAMVVDWQRWAYRHTDHQLRQCGR
jgi:hypothetical protein